MTRPTVGTVAEEIYDACAAHASQDEALGWPLLKLVGAIGAMAQRLDDYADEGPDGELPWSILLDIDRVADADLEHLAQFVGVTIPPSLDAASKRLRIRETDGFKRGTVGAIMGAARQHLIGDKQVVLRERYNPTSPDVDSAYHLTVYTYTDETPDAAAVERALEAQKPAGLILHYESRTGQDWATLVATYSTWADVVAGFTDWADVAATY